MTIWGLLILSMGWLVTLVPASGFLMATAMMTDSGVKDRLEMGMITLAVLLVQAYYIFIPVVLIVAWGGFIFDNIPLTQIALFALVIYISVYVILICLIFVIKGR